MSNMFTAVAQSFLEVSAASAHSCGGGFGRFGGAVLSGSAGN